MGHVTTGMWAVRDVSGVGAARLACAPEASGAATGVAVGAAVAGVGDAGPDAAAVAVTGAVGVGPEPPQAATAITATPTSAMANLPGLRGPNAARAPAGGPQRGSCMSAMVLPHGSAGVSGRPAAVRAEASIVVTDDEREHAWAAVHDSIGRMPGWAIGPCVYPADDDLWHVAAIDLRPRGRHAKREAIPATGTTEIGAQGALVALLDARHERCALIWADEDPGGVEHLKEIHGV